ncbi:ABC transporter substrate-binding protein [Desulfurobacterium indicum]|nr:ABC transporter substrate-binding protein [Desulfurobacterium indicum]
MIKMTNGMKRKILMLSAAIITLTGCFKRNNSQTKNSQEKPQISGTINFYTSLPKTLALKIAKNYEKEYPGVTVNVYRSGASKIMAKLEAEIEAGKITADVVWLADPGNTIFLKNKHLLLKYIPQNAKSIAFKDKDGYFFAGRFIAPVIAFNTKIIQNPPETFKTLTSTTYKNSLPSPWNKARGWCAIPNPLYSGSAVAFVYGISKIYGWKYFQKLKDNGGIVLKSNGSVKNALIQGESAVGVTLDYMVRQQKAKGMNIDYIYPKDGTVLIPSPVAILKTSKNIKAAENFEEFLLSKDTQKLLANNYIIPARIDIKSDKVPSLQSIKQIKIDWNTVSKGSVRYFV